MEFLSPLMNTTFREEFEKPPEYSLKPYSKLSLDVKTRLIAEKLYIYRQWWSNDT